MVKNKPPAIQRSISELSSRISSISPSKRIIQEREESNNQNGVDEPWYVKYAPKKLEEVAIHKKKLQDVCQILESMLKSSTYGIDDGPRILLMTGPSGCSKSTTTYKLAEELVPKYRGSGFQMLRSDRKGSHVVEFVETDNFQEFLVEAKYLRGPNLSVVLIEDLPNIFHTDTRHAFQKSLLEWLYSPEVGSPPLVICITECSLGNENSQGFGVDYNFTAESVLGREILAHPKLARIKFNPINTTLMKKHLRSKCQENRKLLIQNGKWNSKDLVIDQLASTTGDIRSAIANLQYWATSSVEVPLDTREESLTYFHTIGKILHGSRECDDNEMINQLTFNSKSHLANDNFRLGLLENYSLVNGGQVPLSNVCEIVDSLSQSDSMGMNSESIEFALRKVRNQLGSVTKTHTSNKANFPREWKIRQLQLEFQVDSEDYTNVDFYKYHQVRTKRDLQLYYTHYGPLIRSRRNYKRNSLNYYIENLNPNAQSVVTSQNMDVLQVDPNIDHLERIGGPIKSVEEQQELVTNDDSENWRKNSLDQMKQKRDHKLSQLLALHTENEAEEEMEDFDEPIVDSEAEDDDDSSLYDLLSQRHPEINESLSDSDLEDL
ncbi:hypothetical protein ZYGR_0H03400 [Zygosaccharomyces rouxii]|uniref:ZYRO0B11880p n=2 Tax=Zygosaccharomyces rouxii TaxID=4956 RepID=C5DRW5_ZYGRC|nr:uncharacterized protein ZYRO0B11880g [Zygosaccharomyces rouxii]KAH9199944.1 Rad17 cell cycle checkpoint protein-domain-containing protein [Zygosaccharomyces rouxii]GAV47496.1 hypothetical protein ZYGR_0H03400 [Zygosaccharomyces rouxii]CAR26526.1 ZYRO0B11880p [Zygosaccharomyces rouxii]